MYFVEKKLSDLTLKHSAPENQKPNLSERHVFPPKPESVNSEPQPVKPSEISPEKRQASSDKALITQLRKKESPTTENLMLKKSLIASSSPVSTTLGYMVPVTNGYAFYTSKRNTVAIVIANEPKPLNFSVFQQISGIHIVVHNGRHFRKLSIQAGKWEKGQTIYPLVTMLRIRGHVGMVIKDNRVVVSGIIQTNNDVVQTLNPSVTDGQRKMAVSNSSRSADSNNLPPVAGIDCTDTAVGSSNFPIDKLPNVFSSNHSTSNQASSEGDTAGSHYGYVLSLIQEVIHSYFVLTGLRRHPSYSDFSVSNKSDITVARTVSLKTSYIPLYAVNHKSGVVESVDGEGFNRVYPPCTYVIYQSG